MEEENQVGMLNQVCFWLIKQCMDTNAETMTVNQENVRVKGESIGDWEIIVRKKS